MTPAVALAEKVAGSEEAFVERMNERAAELGMTNTVFKNTNGLDDTVEGHVTTARDIAVMSRELITKHPKILEYSSIWMDTIRNGAFGLTNTNRLVRFYRGANGLKTGSTSKAKFCISATALRDGMQLIAVVMASPTRDARNESAKKLLDYGFANFEVARLTPGSFRLCGWSAGWLPRFRSRRTLRRLSLRRGRRGRFPASCHCRRTSRRRSRAGTRSGRRRLLS